MSNFSNIGFVIDSEDDLARLLDQVGPISKPIPTKQGNYFYYSDPSGAELWIQINPKNELIGFNPHYRGKSRFKVGLTTAIPGEMSELDGSFHGWADPLDANDPESGAYPFVFDVPDFKSLKEFILPQAVEIQLSAFAQELTVYDDEEDYHASQTSEVKFATQSFIPIGLFGSDESDQTQPTMNQARGLFAGIIREWEIKKNTFTNEPFYTLLVDTLGGAIDVVADNRFFEKEPRINGVVKGVFWLSGRILTTAHAQGIIPTVVYRCDV